MVLYLYHGLTFGVLEYKVGFDSKLILDLSVLRLAY